MSGQPVGVIVLKTTLNLPASFS